MERGEFIAGLCKTAKLERTALYCRTDAIDPEGIAQQRAALERFAEEHSFGNLACYEDDGYSALKRARPAFARLEADVRGGQIQRVLTKNFSRTSRNTADVVRWLVWLRRHGTEVFVLDTPIDINAALEVMENA